jgi:multisubunit Na+/H+ antiporter MnhG subunit
MRPVLLPLLAGLMGVFLIVYGSLAVWRSDLFLRFHDTFVDRSTWNRNAEWRNHVNDADFKIVGILFVIFGAFILAVMLTKLLALNT